MSLERLEDRVVPSLDWTLFELDGNTRDDPDVAGDDWDTTLYKGGSSIVNTRVLADTAPDLSTFTSGESRDINDLDSWKSGEGSVPKKADILNAYAAAYVNGKDELHLFIGQDRLDTNGAGEVGFWFFQDDISLNTDGTFNGAHTDGDVLILVNFKEGGIGTAEVYQWDPTAKEHLRLLTSTEDVYATTNASEIDAAWRSDIPPNGFFEIGINLTSILDQTGKYPSFRTFLAESRASGSVNAALQDFVLASLQFSTGPDIEIVKKVNGDDANAAPGPAVLAGTDVMFTYEVTNAGWGSLRDVVVRDDNGTPDEADDFSPAPKLGDDKVHNVGDRNNNGVLDPGETWIYTATRTAVVGAQVSRAAGRGTDSRGRTDTDADPAHYFGAAPAVDVEAYVSVDGGATWVDADTATGPSLPSGTDPLFRYVVKNIGNVALDVSLADSSFAGLPQPGVLQANDGADGGPDEFVYVYAGAAWAAGQHSNTATVEASYTDSNGLTGSCGDSDAVHYYGAASQIDVTPVSDGPAAPAGGTPGSGGPAAPDDGLTTTVDPRLVVATLLVPDNVPVPSPRVVSPAPGSAREGFAGQRISPAASVGRVDLLFTSHQAKESPIPPAEGSEETVLPMQPTYDASPGVAFVPGAETFRSLSERVAAAGRVQPGGGEEDVSALLLQDAAGKALRLASSLTEADDSVALVEAITGPGAVSAAEGPAPGPGREEDAAPGSATAGREEVAAPPGTWLWAWIAAAGGLAAPLLMVARRWWPGRRRPPGLRWSG